MLQSLVRKYRQKGVLVDTNLLLGYVIGSIGTQHLINCRATKAFHPDDFHLLDRFLRQFRTIVTTPHVLTETSNLAGRLPETLHPEFRAAFALLIGGFTERFDRSRTIVANEAFLRFGLTDTAISLASPGKHLVLTDELALFGLLQKRGVDVINFNHLRGEAYLQHS